MKIATISIGLFMAGAVGLLVASWRGDGSPTTSGSSVSAGTSGVTEISFELLAQTVTNDKPPPEFPGQLSALAGKHVRISGFPAPYNEPQKMTELLLLRSPGGCYFCCPPDITAVVFVRRLPKDPPLKLDGQPMAFEGTLHLWRNDLAETNAEHQFLFTLNDASAITER